MPRLRGGLWRNEEAPRALRRLKAFHAKHPTFSAYDPAHPWQAVMASACRGVEAMEFWQARLRNQAQRWENGDGKQFPSWVQRQSEFPETLNVRMWKQTGFIDFFAIITELLT